MTDKFTRADLPKLYPAFAAMNVDSSGNPCVWRNNYSCRGCTSEQVDWSDDWSCQCEDDCPNCGKSVSPETSDWIGPSDPDSIAIWEALADK